MHRQGLGLVVRVSSRKFAEERTGFSQVSGEPRLSVCNVPNRRRQDCLHQTIWYNSVALGHRRAKAPTKGLSTLNSIAFELAVYASQRGLLRHHARLASSCWSGSTGRAFHPQGSIERFQSCRLHLIPLSQTSWRKRCDRSFFSGYMRRRCPATIRNLPLELLKKICSLRAVSQRFNCPVKSGLDQKVQWL